MDNQKLLTEAELLQALNITADRTTMWHWRKQGMPYAKVGHWLRYDLAAVQAWLRGRDQSPGAWPWSVWTWVPEGRRPSGEVEPAFWYEECRCRNQTDAENIAKLFQKARPQTPVRVGTARPTDAPQPDAAFPVTEEG